jgi:hypothetical protein
LDARELQASLALASMVAWWEELQRNDDKGEPDSRERDEGVRGVVLRAETVGLPRGGACVRLRRERGMEVSAGRQSQDADASVADWGDVGTGTVAVLLLLLSHLIFAGLEAAVLVSLTCKRW